MAESRKANLLVATTPSTYYQPDTGHAAGWVALRDSAGAALSPALDATENPSGSGNYVCTWNAGTYGAKYGYWWISGTGLVNTEPVYLGLRADHSTRIFYNVTVWNSADTPTGAVGAPKTFTTGTAGLTSSGQTASSGKDSEGRTDFNFTNVPLVFFCDKQTRSAKQIGLVTVSGGNATFTVSVTDDGDNYDATTCKADILIVSRD